jgi:hypothetical protein
MVKERFEGIFISLTTRLLLQTEPHSLLPKRHLQTGANSDKRPFRTNNSHNGNNGYDVVSAATDSLRTDLQL